MLIALHILKNIRCEIEQDLKRRDKPLYGSILALVKGISKDGSTWLTPDPKLNPNADNGDRFRLVVELGYFLNNYNPQRTKRYEPLFDLKSRDQLCLTLNKGGFYLPKSQWQLHRQQKGSILQTSYRIKLWGSPHYIGNNVKPIDKILMDNRTPIAAWDLRNKLLQEEPRSNKAALDSLNEIKQFSQI